MLRSTPLLVAMAMGLVGCAFDWASLDPRETEGAQGGAGATGGAGTGVGGDGGEPTTTSSTTSTSSTGGSTGDGGAGGTGGAPTGAGGTGGAGGSPPTFSCNGQVVPELSNGQIVTGSTLQAPTDFEGGCAETTGGEIVYAFQLSATSDVLVDTTLPGTNYDTVLHVREGACEDATNEVGCLDRGVGDDLMLPALPAGTYYVIVDSHTISNEGNFELQVSW